MTSSIADTLKAKIEYEILMFNFKPGDRLDECRLADLYGSSRTPVREALRLLAAEGLVRLRPHRGAVVSGLSISELNEMFEMLSIYEGVCARLAATHATPEEIQDIENMHSECEAQCDADDQQAYCLANARFHEAIYRASHNRYLIKRTISTRNRLGSYLRFQLRRNNRLRESLSEHEAVLCAIRKGHAEEADMLMRAHIATQSSPIPSLVTNLPPEYFSECSKTHPQPAGSSVGHETYMAAALAFE